jgi:hypothetical protein
MNPVRLYLRRLYEIHATERGTPELSFRAALENLLNAVGEDLRPEVGATHELADTGAGHPDFGLFEKRSGNARGAVECKGPDEEVPQTADGKQVSKYWKHYGTILVTNYRDFLLVASEGGSATPRVEARYELARDCESFWSRGAESLTQEHEDALIDFLKGVLTRAAPILRADQLADDLARHAREARRRLGRHDTSALEPLQKSMEKALGLHFTDEDGQAFFRSSLVQTLFYGLFSGWMLWRESAARTETFSWQEASDFLALPLIGELYEEIARPRRLTDLGLREPLEWATTSLNRVVEEEFFSRFETDHAITLFYEPFLEAFDPNLRKELGVWYTPPEIVTYMVGRVDQLLRTELGIEDGLADDQVYVLDPAAGTGSYLVEVSKRIHRTLTEQGHGALAAAGVKKAIQSRIFGFEILAAPYVVAHLQLGVLLRLLGAPLTAKERCEVYLTNALTGWEPPKGVKATREFPLLFKEAERANSVKRTAPIIVVLGNPPYNAFAGVAQDEEGDLIAPYFEGRETYDARGHGLSDLYVRFYRLAERRIGEISKRGIVSFISNYSWLDGQSHPVMRKRFLDAFDQIWIDNCNGDKYKTGKRTPDGKPDQSMFTTDAQPVGIQVGTAIATLVKRGNEAPDAASVYYRDLWGLANAKRLELVTSLTDPNLKQHYSKLTPSLALRFILRPGQSAAGYERWPRLPELFIDFFTGVKTSRDEFVVDIDREPLEERITTYFDKTVKDDSVAQQWPSAMKESKQFPAKRTRDQLLKRGLLPSNFVRFTYRPFDDRWLYWEPEGKLLDRKREDYFPQVFEGNIALTSAAAIRKGEVDGPLPIVHLGCIHIIERTANIFPLLHKASGEMESGRIESNINHELLIRLCELRGEQAVEEDGFTQSRSSQIVSEKLFYHMIAVLWSPAYREDNEASLRQDWPRIPIPADPSLLDTSSELGRAVVDLLLPDKPVSGITKGRLKAEIKELAIPMKVGGGNINPDTDLKVDAGWGFYGRGNAVMCGAGRISPNETDPKNAIDVYLNDKVYWSHVPNAVWAMHIGGYPVIKKWLSYRDNRVIDRPLRLEEVTFVTEMVRRLQALLLMSVDLDANYRTVATNAISFAAQPADLDG